MVTTAGPVSLTGPAVRARALRRPETAVGPCGFEHTRAVCLYTGEDIHQSRLLPSRPTSRGWAQLRSRDTCLSGEAWMTPTA